MTIRRLSLAAGLVLAAVGCSNDDLITPPVPQYKGGPMFQRYVAMGNSITAGFQSGGINDSTQQQSYAVLLARGMHSPFFLPLLNRPGCPPPYTNVFLQTRVGGATPTTCALRNIPNPPPPFISNTAVPGALVIDIYNNGAGAHPNTLTQFI